MGNLAFFCCDHLDSPGRAEPLFVECLDRANRTLGHEHPFTLLCTSNFGACLRELGRLAEARATLEACVDAAGRVLGPEHRYTVLATDNLGLCLLRQGEAGEAARVLAGIEDASTPSGCGGDWPRPAAPSQAQVQAVRQCRQLIEMWRGEESCGV